MKFEIVDDSEHPIRLTLEASEDEEQLSEINVVRAAYREAILLRAEKGNTGSISDFDRYVAKKAEEDTDTDLVLTLRSKNQIIEVLEQFHDRTDEAIVDIPEQSLIPPFENDYIVTRFTLGTMALNLADDIREATGNPPLTEWEIEQQVDTFSSELDKPFPEP